MRLFQRFAKVNKVVKASVFFLLGLFAIILACKGPADLYSPKEWRELFDTAGGWTPLPIPDSKYSPGAIIKVTDGVYYVDDLESCRYPLKEFLKESYVPGISFTKAWEFGANAMISYKGIGAGPEFDKVSKVRMEVKDQGADALRVLKIKVWMQDPDNRGKVSQICMEELLKPNRYLITEAFRVSKGKYTLMDETGAAIKLKTGILGRFLKVEPNMNFQITSDGGLVIEQPAYFAIRYAVRVDKDFETLGAVGVAPEIADAKIEKLFFETSAKLREGETNNVK